MPKFAHSDTLDGGPNAIKAAITGGATMFYHVLKAYTTADTYATALGNSVLNAALVNADLVMSASGANRLLTVAAKSAVTAGFNSGATPALHLAILDSTNSKVWLVTQESSGSQVNSGTVWNLPSWTYTLTQPT